MLAPVSVLQHLSDNYTKFSDSNLNIREDLSEEIYIWSSVPSDWQEILRFLNFPSRQVKFIDTRDVRSLSVQ